MGEALSDVPRDNPTATQTRTAPDHVLTLHLRSRVELFKGSGIWEELFVEQTLPARTMALLLCDVWNDHWCKGAARRLDDLVPRMNAAVGAARKKGIQIVHAPSETMEFYADYPQRRRICDAPRLDPPQPRDLTSPRLPIDDSDGGCDSGERPWYRAWTRQHPGISIEDADVISDNGAEIYSFLAQREITTLLIAGVHTNMCVLNRSFAIKQMTRWGMRCVLVRDLTDAMYNPERPPRVSHAAGTDLVIQYIEKYWCPSMLSDDLR